MIASAICLSQRNSWCEFLHIVCWYGITSLGRSSAPVTTQLPLLPPLVNTSRVQDMEAVAKAIRESPLQLGARVEGKEVHVPVPR